MLDFAMVKKLPHPIDEHVGSRVRMRRMMLGVTQEKLADTLGIAFQQVQKYEKGANRISASRLQHIAHILQVPESFFFDDGPNKNGKPGRIGGASQPDPVSALLASADGLALVKAYMALDDAKLRRSIVQLVSELSGHA
jgi:transcriptional regulator with XRE-family HTH domain